MCEYFCLENSCLTLALKKDFTFISAFPGFLTFGFVAKTHYKKNKYFHFSHFDLSKLYSAILHIVHFIADDTDQIVKTDILTKQIEDIEVKYFILGNIIANDKIVKFRLEANLEIFELSFTVFQLNDFLCLLNDIIMACLCLQAIEKDMICNAILKPLEEIVNFQNVETAKNFLLTHYGNTLCITQIENLTTSFVHYNFIIILLHKFKSLINKEMIPENLFIAIIDQN